MDKIKEILRLKEGGFSYRDIAASVGCGKSVVGETIRRADAANIRSGLEHTEAELEALLFPDALIYSILHPATASSIVSVKLPV